MDYAKNNLKDNNIFSNKNQNMGNNSFMTPDDKNDNNTTSDNKKMPPDDKNSSNEKENNPSSSETTDNNESSQNNGNAPDKKDDTNMNDKDFSNQNTPPNDLGGMGKDDFSNRNDAPKLTTVYYCIFGLEVFLISITVIYLIMSKANKLSFKETLSTRDKKIIYLLETLLTSIVFVGGIVFVTNQYFLASTISSNTKPNGNLTSNESSIEATGNILVDSISTLTLNLEDSTYEGAINSENTAKSINVSLDKDSTITLTNDSYITSLNDSDSTYSNINFNGYKLYVNGKAIN